MTVSVAIPDTAADMQLRADSLAYYKDEVILIWIGVSGCKRESLRWIRHCTEGSVISQLKTPLPMQDANTSPKSNFICNYSSFYFVFVALQLVSSIQIYSVWLPKNMLSSLPLLFLSKLS